MSGVLGVCFTLSGAAALGLELLWMRAAGLVLGATAPTAATVLACYFAGLALGAALGRRGSARPVRCYGLLELAASLGALWSAGVFAVLGSDGAQRVLLAGGVPARIGAIALAVLPATICLGATLPVLGHAFAAPGDVGRRGGRLYALNTLGGVAGVAAMGFGLPALIGVRASYLMVAAASTAAGLAALAVGRRAPVVAAPLVSAPVSSRVRLVAAGAGALGLGVEVLWTRLFSQVLHNSVYSFAAVTLVVVLCLAVGAALAVRVLGAAPPAAVAAGALAIAGIATGIGPWCFVRLTGDLGYVGMRTDLGEYVVRIVALAAATVGPAALASGLVLPALWAAAGEASGAAVVLGELSAASMAGGIAGALLAGFAVLPAIGVWLGLVAAAGAYGVMAVVAAPPRARLPLVAGGALTVVALLALRRGPLVSLVPGETLRSIAEGASGVVTVVETGDDLQLRLDNHYLLGGSAAAAAERRLGLVPLLLHPAPRRVAFIGMATGISASAGPALGVEETTVIELVPEVAAAARASFAAWNGGLLDRADVRLVVDDGRRVLAAEPARYDVIVGDLFVPWHAGAGNLYAREMLETVARRLAPDGLFCQWLPLYQLTREEFDVIARTFLTVFPDVSVWRNDFYPDRPVVGLVGRRAARPLDLASVDRRLDALPAWSRDPLLATSRGLLMLALGDLSLASDLVPPGPLDSDDEPTIEFLAPRMTRMSAAGDKDWFTGDPLVAFAEVLAARTPVEDEAASAARRAGLALARYALAARRGDDDAAARSEAEVRRLVPDVVAARDDGPPALDGARRALDRLRAQAARVRGDVVALERRLRAPGRSDGTR
jgi:spermidine synthase